MSEEWRNEETKILDFYGMVNVRRAEPNEKNSADQRQSREFETRGESSLWAIQTINLDFFQLPQPLYRPSIVYEISLISLLSFAVITSRLHYVQIIIQSQEWNISSKISFRLFIFSRILVDIKLAH